MTCFLFPAKEANTDLALGGIQVSAYNLWIGLFHPKHSSHRDTTELERFFHF